MKKLLVLVLAAVMVFTMGAGLVMAEEAGDDQAAADAVMELIADIQVQTRTEDTDAQIAAAKEAWDALTDEQKELVEEGDYFSRDTGDASLDDPRNQDEIGENELLVVSFGTSFNDSRVKDIKAIEDALAAAYPEYAVRRAFTAQIIINHIQARDGEVIDNVAQALDRAVANGVKNLVVQPTMLMHGAEYDEMMETLDEYATQFDLITGEETIHAEGRRIEPKKAAKAAGVYGDLVVSAKQLLALAESYKGHANADIAKLTKQIRELTEKFR